MSWRITSINNATHEVTLTKHTGEALQVTIPDTHLSKEMSQAHLKSCTDAHDAAALQVTAQSAVPTVAQASLQAPARPYALWIV